jgi:hypothetical protein
MNEQLEFNVGEGEQPATVQVPVEEEAPRLPLVTEEEPRQARKEEELDQYSEGVQKRINKLTARLRETQRREQAALEYAKQVQARAQELEQQYVRTDEERLVEAKSRVETQAVALKQIIRKAREEGDIDTETEAQQRLTALTMEQGQLDSATAQRQAYLQQQQYAAQQAAYQAQQAQQPAQQQQVDPRVEEWAEKNKWYGRDNVMTHAAWGIHRQLIQVEGFDPSSDEYYDELDKRIRDAFPQKFGDGGASTQSRTRNVQTVAPASRSSGINNTARRTVKLTPSQVAIAKKLGVPLEEYAKYVKE